MKHVNPRAVAAVMVLAIVALSALPAGAQETKWEKQTDFQKRLKPARLPMVEADYSGTPLPATPVVETISRFKCLYRFGNFYVGGQPPLEELQWLKEQGVTTIVNLRTEEELRGYAEEAYDEKAVAEKLGFIYRALPVNGIQGYTPENLQKFIGLIDPSAQTLIQCRTACRATEFFVAYLIRTGDSSVKEALDIGQEMKMVLPLAKLLGQDFEIILKD